MAGSMHRCWLQWYFSYHHWGVKKLVIFQFKVRQKDEGNNWIIYGLRGSFQKHNETFKYGVGVKMEHFHIYYIATLNHCCFWTFSLWFCSCWPNRRYLKSRIVHWQRNEKSRLDKTSYTESLLWIWHFNIKQQVITLPTCWLIRLGVKVSFW